MTKKALVLGAGGFIGSHMVDKLKERGYYVRGIDLKHPEFKKTTADEFIVQDLRNSYSVNKHIVFNHGEPFVQPTNFDEIYQFAADMGGAAYIFTGIHDADIMQNSARINLNVLEALKEYKFKGKIFYSSSACIYPNFRQTFFKSYGLKESDAYPANPDSEYGWEKLFSERMYLSYARNHGIDVRIARFHNIYGPYGTYVGGKEKAPAAMCRKALTATDGDMEVWGPGIQTRSFLYIDDCIEAVQLLMQSDYKYPINIGSEEDLSINDLARIAISLTGKEIKIRNIDGPVGVNGRNSNNDLVRKELGWEPKYSIREGMEKTFNWIKQQIDGTSSI